LLEPTDQQRLSIQNTTAPTALVQFLAVKDWAAFEQYRSASERAVQKAGGQRTHDVHIDQILAGGDLHYQAISVDLFRSAEGLLIAYEMVDVERSATLSDVYALLVRPRAGLPRIGKALGFLAPLFSRWLGTDTEKEMVGFAEYANPETGPIPETVEVMRKHDQSTHFFMMNLNKYYSKARYKNGEVVPGEQAYNRYASRIMPYLISVRGYPSIIGPTIDVFVGDENSQLHDDWSEFAMVFYPSRKNFIRMMSNSPTKGVYHREAGLERAVLMPSSSFLMGDQFICDQ